MTEAEDYTIAWVDDPAGEGPGTWGVLDVDGTVLDRYEDVTEAQRDYPGALVIR